MKIIIFSNFTKRVNSTKQPLDSAGTKIDVFWKEGSSVENPVFELRSTDVTINYVKAWGNYYFVTDVETISLTDIRLHCSKDVLATYKTEIGSYTAFVERSASSYDLDVHDAMISQKQDYVEQIDGAPTTIAASTVKQGAYIIRTLGRWGINSYLASAAEVQKILYYAYDPNNADFISFATGQLERGFSDPGQYIVDLRWVAFSDSMLTDLSGRPQDLVYLGWFQVTDNGNALSLPRLDPIGATYPTPLVWDTYSVAVPARYYNDFRDYDSSWSKYSIYVPGCGEHELDALAVKNGITIDYAVDTLTGDVLADVYSGTADPYRALLFETRGSIGASIQIGKVTSAGTGVVNSIADQFGNKIAELFGKTQIANVTNAVTKKTASVIGSVGSRGLVQYKPDAYITKFVVGSKDIPAASAGRPCYLNKQISSLSGFVLCSGASVPIAGEQADKEAVNGYLNGGFYYE